MGYGGQAEGWSDAGAWHDEDLRREVFFFRVGDVDLYGSLYAARDLTRSTGVIACGSWGVEADRTDPLLRAVALGMARLGGAGMVFHYPGYSDSFGELAGLGMVELAEAAREAVAEARRRVDVEWILAGLMLGASVAALAGRSAGLQQLLLVQPELCPGSYFDRLRERSEPLAPGSSPREMLEVGSASGMAYGYPIPSRIADHGPEADAAVATALGAFEGQGAVIRHESPRGPDLAPPRFERVDVRGAWRFAAQNNPGLAAATIECLERRTAAATAPTP
jgi:hypothetical protein